VDSREALRKGGTRGSAVVPNEPESSLLFKAIRYDDPALKMPPSGRLSDAEIEDFREWIASGAADPRQSSASAPAAASIDWAKARDYWAFRPLEPRRPPPTRNRSWAVSDVDRFLLARLEARRLTPAPPADRRTLLRRLSLDLTGLPPTSEELDAFLRDSRPGAYERVVARLLASPHYGERQARHWLDLVRFAETKGHEFDAEIPEAWRYRDYVIRAINEDLPYDRFILEHLAGDQLRHTRFGPGLPHADTPLATGFMGLGEERNAADDIAEVRLEKLDNQVDVFAKAFLGLTVSCARCHDHKFDPIPTADYYALAGVFHSTQVIQAAVDTPARRREIEIAHGRVERLNAELRARVLPSLRAYAAQWRSRILGEKDALKRPLAEPDHLLHPLAVLSRPDPENRPFEQRARALLARLAAGAPGRGDVEVSLRGWTLTGAAFGDGPRHGVPPNQALGGYGGGDVLNSMRGGAQALTGTAVSRAFRLTKPYVHVRVGGVKDSGGRREVGRLAVAMVADGRPELFSPEGDGQMVWRTIRPRRHLDQWVYFEVRDKSRDGHIALERIVLSDAKEPPPAPPDPRVLELLRNARSLDELLDGYQWLFESAADDRALAAMLGPRKAEDLAPPELASLLAERKRWEDSIPESTFGLVAVDDAPHNLRIHRRGSYANLGEEAPRALPRALGGGEPFRSGSGRLELAEAITRGPASPLLARVIVNRVWKHLFGEGLVRTVDNFGATGEKPSHPELLEYLAAAFQKNQWSIKWLHAELVNTAAYRMSSAASAAALALDPDNRLLQHMPVRRLEAEEVRDSILAVSGSLDRTPYGPPVAPHISAYQDGRGKSGQSGPLDGAGRRSIYLQVRRNFITPLLLAFDYPIPVQTTGRRLVSTVPSQALMLMNNEFVAGQAESWAKRILALPAAERLDRMFLAAYSRPPLPAERRDIGAFLTAQKSRYPAAEATEHRIWADLAHVLLNSKEFLFVR